MGWITNLKLQSIAFFSQNVYNKQVHHESFFQTVFLAYPKSLAGVFNLLGSAPPPPPPPQVGLISLVCPPTHPLLRVCVHSVCVFTAVCVHLDG